MHTFCMFLYYFYLLLQSPTYLIFQFFNLTAKSCIHCDDFIKHLVEREREREREREKSNR